MDWHIALTDVKSSALQRLEAAPPGPPVPLTQGELMQLLRAEPDMFLSFYSTFNKGKLKNLHTPVTNDLQVATEVHQRTWAILFQDCVLMSWGNFHRHRPRSAKLQKRLIFEAGEAREVQSESRHVAPAGAIFVRIRGAFPSESGHTHPLSGKASASFLPHRPHPLVAWYFCSLQGQSTSSTSTKPQGGGLVAWYFLCSVLILDVHSSDALHALTN